jgi:hypothetical protein
MIPNCMQEIYFSCWYLNTSFKKQEPLYYLRLTLYRVSDLRGTPSEQDATMQHSVLVLSTVCIQQNQHGRRANFLD